MQPSTTNLFYLPVKRPAIVERVRWTPPAVSSTTKQGDSRARFPQRIGKWRPHLLDCMGPRQYERRTRMAEPALAYSPPPCPALDAILALDEDSLPYTDDTPMPDGRIQQGPLDYSREGIRYHLRDKRDQVAVDSDMFVYYIGRDKRGQPTRASVAPDVFVVLGVPDRPDRKSYVLWKEPDAKIRFVLEIASGKPPPVRCRAVGDDLPTYNESEQRRQTAEARVAELEALLRGREG